MEIREVSYGSSDDLSDFLQVAADVYRSDPIWVPEMLTGAVMRGIQPRQRLRAVLVIEGTRATARAAFFPAESGTVGQIGFFEAVHPAAGKAVLARCEERLRQLGMERILAPKVDSTSLGLLAAGFRLPQTILTNHNPAFYKDIFLETGYRVEQTLYSYLFNRRTARLLRRSVPNVQVRSLNLERLDAEIRIFHALQMAIFAESPDYAARSLEDDRSLVAGLRPYLDPDLVLIAEDMTGKPIGLLVCLPDMYQKLQGHSVDRARIISVGALPGQQNRGVGVALVTRLVDTLLAKGYNTVEASWIQAYNKRPQNLAKRFLGTKGREFILLGKDLA